MFLLSINQSDLGKEAFDEGIANGTILTKEEFNYMKKNYEDFINGTFSGTVINNPGYFIDMISINKLIRQDDGSSDRITGLACIFGINRKNEITIMIYSVDKDNKPWGVNKLGSGEFFLCSDGFGSCCSRKLTPLQKTQPGCVDLLAFFETDTV
jgi:hypothetical protein